MSDNVQFSIRIPRELQRILRFIAADRNCSLNKTILLILQEAVEEGHILPPNELLTTKALH